MTKTETFPVTKSQFEKTVQRWMDYAFKNSTSLDCGFCEASGRARKKDKLCGCSHCALNPYYCGGSCDLTVWDRWAMASNEFDRTQAALEMLEGLYDYGVKAGFIDPCADCALGIDGVCIPAEE
jgi:hypothetical protein